jgi:hypothetical protein
MPAAYFVVRATVTDASKRAAFDTWYETEHVPDAVKAFGVSKAWRFWSLDDPSLHQAMYQFDDEAKLQAMLKGDALKQRRWCWRRNLRSSAPPCHLCNERERAIQPQFMSRARHFFRIMQRLLERKMSWNAAIF